MEISYDVIMQNEQSPWVVLIHGFGGSGRMFKKQFDKFKNYFNILTLDLPGHGKSKIGLTDKAMSLNGITHCVIDLLHKLNIHKADFVGISLGTIIVTSIAIIEPDLVDKVILGGAVCGVNILLESLVKLVNVLKYIFPYTMLVSIFAHLMMPKANHKKSRSFMIRESKCLGKVEFGKWFELVVENLSYIKNNIKYLKRDKSLFIMGQQDYVFMHNVINVSNKYNIELDTIENCGHVCNIDKYNEFNNLAIGFFLE